MALTSSRQFCISCFVVVLLWTGWTVFALAEGKTVAIEHFGDAASADAQTDDGKTVEIFVDGKKYRSFEEYRQYKNGDALQGLGDNIRTGSGEEKKKEGEQNLLQPMRPEGPSGSEAPETGSQEDDVAVIEGMLKEYYLTHDDKEQARIDPDKLKTIQIKPASP